MELFWNDYTGYSLHWSFVLWTDYPDPIDFFFSPPHHLFISSFSNYFDTQLLKSTREMLKD